MCYLVAKDINKQGCYIVKTKRSPELVELIRRLNKIVGDHVQLVTISRPNAYGEYEPYRFVNNEIEFESTVAAM